MQAKRIFLLVADSFGIGGAPDAAAFGDEGSNTLASIAASPRFHAPNLMRMGLGNLTDSPLPAVASPIAAHGRLAERSAGKDTVIGHWEIAGCCSAAPLPTYPNGFPAEILEKIERRSGIGAICNRPYSGTEVLKDYGAEMMASGRVIVYTSADSVFQVAAHEDVIPLDGLYEYCRVAREVLTGEHAVGRVIARPFVGSEEEGFTRTAGRHDFALEAPGVTALDLISQAGMQVIGVGKIGDIFNRRGISRSYPTADNAEGLDRTEELMEEDFSGLCFVNLVDFDSKYGHRRDRDGYAEAVSAFDARLGRLMERMGQEDVLMITADHGCDPCAHGTDHTRERVPILVFGKGIRPVALEDRKGFCDVGCTVCRLLGVDPSPLHGRDFARALRTGVTDRMLLDVAKEAMTHAYAPYSRFRVGAALLGEDGRIYRGCNVENAAYSPTICAERGAVANAVASGARSLAAIAVVGGREGVIDGFTRPCGVCRQVLCELCPSDFPILSEDGEGRVEERTLASLLPDAFGAQDISH